jgi:tRNA(Ile)-lysidine synthase
MNKTMIEQTQTYIKQNKLFSKSDRLLVAVSGGFDSICLLYILHKLKYKIEVAHCNFNLRNDESNRDEDYVIQFCEELKIKLHKTNFDTKAYSKKRSISIEMGARELRYNWFEELILKQKLTKIAIAHNSNDVIETFFINLNRGSGLKGLTSIKPINGHIVRPILFASRNEILNYCEENGLSPKMDSTNLENDYLRNKFRNIIIPEFNSINPDFEKTILSNIKSLNETYSIFNDKIQEEKKKVSFFKEENLHFDIQMLKKLSPLNTYLYEFVKEFGFKASQIPDLVNILDSETGKLIESETHIILKNRDELIIFKNINLNFDIELNFEKKNKFGLSFSQFAKDGDFKIIKDLSIAQLDFDKISFPLRARNWKEGDSFIPLGMKNKVKLKDFFINNKFSKIEKQTTPLLVDASNKIIWIVGHRIDDRFKVVKNTKRVLKIIRS